MTTFSKAHWSTESDNTIRMSMDFTKVNKEKRLVSGFATLDNLDSQGDIVLAEASRKAFSRARGNLREMHKKDSAVGKIVDFYEKEYVDPSGQKFKGIYVSAYISRGAQDTWEKVLDGTLSGFSIGGNVIDSTKEFAKDGSGKQVNVIKDYDLIELSLVDNPANQLANVFQIHKAADGSVTVEGMATEVDVINIFFCETDKIATESTEDSATCPVCTEKMNNIGWVEDGSDRDEKVNQTVAKFLSPSTDAKREGGVDMAKGFKFTQLVKSESVKEDETVETGHEEGDPTEVPTPAVPAEEADEVTEVEETTEETPDEVNEVHDEGVEISKKIDELKGVVTETLEKTRKETSEQVSALEKRISELSESFDNKTSEFDKRFAELDENLETAKSRLADFTKSLQSMNSEQAFRKSADFEESAEIEQKSDNIWGGALADPRGAFSVNNMLR